MNSSPTIVCANCKNPKEEHYISVSHRKCKLKNVQLWCFSLNNKQTKMGTKRYIMKFEQDSQKDGETN